MQKTKLPLLVLVSLCATGAFAQSTNTPTELPPITILGTNTAAAEDLPIGPNQQPEWTARRRFTTTRVYVQPPWQAEVEIGLDNTIPREGRPAHLLQEELELGLPWHSQIDFEEHDQNFFEGDDVTRKWHHDSCSLELGHALAEWGKIPLNPTIKGEWKFNDGTADNYELQLLLGDNLGPLWHYGLNFFYEQQIGSDLVREFAGSQAISYTLIDEKLSAGLEMLFRSESDKDSRNDPENSFIIGPSVQWRPTTRTHLDVSPLFGIGAHSPNLELFVFFGIDLGPGSREPEGLVPTSLRGK